MLAAGHAPRLVQHEQARELAGLGPAYQHAMQPDDDEFGQRRLDIVRGQCEQRQHEPLVHHRLERQAASAFGNSPSSTRGARRSRGPPLLRVFLPVENGNHVIEAWRPAGVRAHPPLRIDAAPLERLLHGIAQNGMLAGAEAEHALQHARDGENVLDGLGQALRVERGHERVEGQAPPAHIVDLQPDGLHEAALRIVVLEVEDADGQAHARHAVDQHVERLRFARARIAGNEHAAVQQLGLVLERRPEHVAPGLARAQHDRWRRRAERRGGFDGFGGGRRPVAARAG